MVLSKVALYCLESNPYFAHDILFTRAVRRIKNRYEKFHSVYENSRKNSNKFYEYTKMSVDTFDYIVEKVENKLKQKRNDKYFSVAERVFLTLRFLSSETSCTVLAQIHGLGRSTVSVIVYRTLKNLWKSLVRLHMPKLTTEYLKTTSSEFYLKWEFPNCIGCIAAKHFYVHEPRDKSKNATIMLQGISDADYKFLAFEVIDETEDDDDATFEKSELMPQIRSIAPPPQNLPYSNTMLPHVLIGDEEYPLKPYLLRPYPQRRNMDQHKDLFNKTLRKPAVVIYRTFNLLVSKWSILKRPIKTNLSHAILITKVACLLYNVIRDMDGDQDKEFQELVPKHHEARNTLRYGIRSKRNNRYSDHAKAVREEYRKYFIERTEQ